MKRIFHRSFIQTLFEILPIVILSLIPLLWYKGPNWLALGHDMGFPLEPKGHFLDRFYTWTDRFGLGADQRLAVGAIFIHGIEAIPSFLGLSIFQTQKITFIFWMLVQGLSMFYLLKTLYPQRNFLIMRVFGSIFYVFNHFFLQAWSIAERTKFSIATAIPLTMAILIKYQRGELGIATSSVLIGIILFFFNGGGTPPFIGPFVVLLFLSVLFFIIIDLREKGTYGIIKYCKFLTALTLVVLAINAYWIFPLISLYFDSYQIELAMTGGVRGVVSWINLLSQHANLVNLFRLQGIPDWYDNPNQTYSRVFLENKLFIIASFLFPLASFLSYLVSEKKSRKIVSFFIILSLVGIALAGGTKGPLGEIYIYLVSYVPGFAVFRTPFYKFGLLLWFSYSFLIAFTVNQIYRAILVKFRLFPKYIGLTFLVLTFLFYLYYNFPFFDGSFFNFLAKPFSTMVKVPESVLTFRDVAQTLGEGRVLVLPDQEPTYKVDRYPWGYWSTTPLVSILSRGKFLLNDHSKTENEQFLLKNIYASLREEDWERFEFFARILDIHYVLVRKDYLSDSLDSDPLKFLRSLNPNPKFSEKWKQGDWTLFEYSDYRKYPYLKSPLATLVSNKIVEVDMDLLGLSKEEFLFVNFGDQEEKRPFSDMVENPKEDIVLAASCQGCNGERPYSSASEPANFWPGSLLFSLVEREEKSHLAKLPGNSQKLSFSVEMSLKRLRELEFLFLTRKDDTASALAILSKNREWLGQIEDLISHQNSPEKSEEIDSLNLAYQFLLSEKELAFEFLDDVSSKRELYLKLQNNLFIISGLIEKIKPWVWIGDKSHLNFFLDVPVGRQYDFYLDKRDLGEFFSDETDVILSVDGYLVSSEIQDFDKYIRLGEKTLDKGVHKVSITGVRDRNLVETNNRNFSIMSLATTQECRVLDIPNFKPDDNYLIRLSQRNEAGIPLWIFIELDTNKKSDALKEFSINEPVPANGKDWTQAGFLLRPEKGSSSARVNLCSQPKGKIASINSVKDLEIIRDITPTLVLRYGSESQDGKAPTEENTTLDLKRINQTKYLGILSKKGSEKQFIVLPERFDKNWMMYLEDKPLNEKDHFEYEGYGNAWKISQSGDFKVKIEYAPQRTFVLGWLVSLLSLISAGLFFLFKGFSKPKTL